MNKIIIYNWGCNEIVKFAPKFFEISDNRIMIKFRGGFIELQANHTGEIEFHTFPKKDLDKFCEETKNLGENGLRTAESKTTPRL